MSGFQISCTKPATAQPPLPACAPVTTPTADLCTNMKALPAGVPATVIGMDAAGNCVKGPAPSGGGSTTVDCSTCPQVHGYVKDVVLQDSSLTVLYDDGTAKSIDLCAAIVHCNVSISQITGLLTWLQSQAIAAAQVTGLCAAVTACGGSPPCTSPCVSQAGLALPPAVQGASYQQDILLAGAAPFTIGAPVGLPSGMSVALVVTLAGTVVRMSGVPNGAIQTYNFSIPFANCANCTLTGTVAVISPACNPVTAAALA